MAVIEKSELLTRIKKYMGDRTDDETLSLLEDATDTLNQKDDWEQKYKDNDEEWRRRYRDRFENGNQVRKDMVEDKNQVTNEDARTYEQDVPDDTDNEELFDDIFQEKESDD